MLASQSMSEGSVPTSSPYLLKLRFITSIGKHSDQDSDSTLASSGPSKPAPEDQILKTSSSPGSNTSSSDSDTWDHTYALISTSSSAQNSVSLTISKSPQLSQEKSDFDEESTSRYKHLDPLTETLRRGKSTFEIHSDIYEKEDPIIIFNTKTISYELFYDLNLIEHLQDRIANDSFLCTLTSKKDIHKSRLSSLGQLLLLGRVRARYKASESCPKSFSYDLQYLVGLTFQKRPRELWLIYNHSTMNDYEVGINQLQTQQDQVQYSTAEAMLKGKFELGRICSDISQWDPKKGLLEKEVEQSLASFPPIFEDVLDFKASTSPSDVSQPGPYPEQEEPPDREASSEQKSTSGVEEQAEQKSRPEWEALREQKSTSGVEKHVEQKSTPEWKVSLTRSDLKKILQDTRRDLSEEEVDRIMETYGKGKMEKDTENERST